MENPQLIQEDEIDLREYVKVIIKRKKFIISFVAIAVIASVVFALMTPKAYKATATIMITPSAVQSALSPNKSLWDSQKPDATTGEASSSPLGISIATHVDLLKSNIVLGKTIAKLGLKEASGKEMDVEALLGKLNIKKTVGENIINLEVTDVNPQEARDIANAWAEQYVEYSQELISGEVNGIGDFVMNQFEAAKKNLFKAEEAVNSFNKEYKLDLMNAELTMKKGELNSYKTELAGMGLVLKTKEDTLLELKKQIATQKKFNIVSKAITDDALWQANSKPDGFSGLDKKGLKSEDINPIYQDLETRIVNGEIDINTLSAREEYLNKLIDSLTEETKLLEDNIIQKNFDLIQLTRQVDIYKKSYDDFSKKIQEARITKEAQLGEVKIVSPASTPNYAVGGRSKTVILTGILSLIFAMFAAFFMEFLQKVK